jgi:hypothetical protein
MASCLAAFSGPLGGPLTLHSVCPECPFNKRHLPPARCRHGSSRRASAPYIYLQSPARPLAVSRGALCPSARPATQAPIHPLQPAAHPQSEEAVVPRIPYACRGRCCSDGTRAPTRPTPPCSLTAAIADVRPCCRRRSRRDNPHQAALGRRRPHCRCRPQAAAGAASGRADAAAASSGAAGAPVAGAGIASSHLKCVARLCAYPPRALQSRLLHASASVHTQCMQARACGAQSIQHAHGPRAAAASGEGRDKRQHQTMALTTRPRRRLCLQQGQAAACAGRCCRLFLPAAAGPRPLFVLHVTRHEFLAR